MCIRLQEVFRFVLFDSAQLPNDGAEAEYQEISNYKKLISIMAVFYTLYQNNREGFATKGKWYARVRVNKVKTMKDIAREIQDIASVRKSDVMAVLTELPDVMNKMLQEGHRVKLDGFGSFKVGIKTKPSDTVKDFSFRVK